MLVTSSATAIEIELALLPMWENCSKNPHSVRINVEGGSVRGLQVTWHCNIQNVIQACCTSRTNIQNIHTIIHDLSSLAQSSFSTSSFRYELYTTNKQNFQEEATRQLVGSIVLTRYNNRTYRVDDIAWDKNPQSTFVDHTGKAITFIDYYKWVWL